MAADADRDHARRDAPLNNILCPRTFVWIILYLGNSTCFEEDQSFHAQHQLNEHVGTSPSQAPCFIITAYVTFLASLSREISAGGR